MEKKIALYLDDIRTPTEEIPDHEWKIVRNYQEFCNFITNYFLEHRKLPDLISFDHDLAEEHYGVAEDKMTVVTYDMLKEKTGMHCAKWLTTVCDKNKVDLRNTKLSVHSMNPVGAQNIQLWLNTYLKVTYGAEHATCFTKQYKSEIKTIVHDN